MRNAVRIMLVATMAMGVVALGAVPGGAGAPGANTVTIEKEVVGTAPAGTVFAANLDCQSILGSGAALVPSVTFDKYASAGERTSRTCEPAQTESN